MIGDIRVVSRYAHDMVDAMTEYACVVSFLSISHLIGVRRLFAHAEHSAPQIM